jgi:levansucrase
VDELPGDPSAWRRSHAAGLRRTAETVAPVIYPPAEKTLPGRHLWDTWLLRTRDGAVASVDGYRVAFSLTAPDDLLPGKRHDVATVRYYYSRDGRQWTDGGPVFADSAPLGSRQWAGCALYDDGDVLLYYTAAGDRDESALSYRQHLALATGGVLETDASGLRIRGPYRHESLLHPDGRYYETETQSRGMLYTFRDPWFFADPATGRTWLLFEGNVPVLEGSDWCGGDPAQQEFNGCVGVAESPAGDPTDFELRPPVLHGTCVNQELERPHVVYRDGRYYLFVSSHAHTFAPGLSGFDGLYGFVADDLRGEYEPLNDTGLVLTNPANAPFQAYSWTVYDHGDELLATSFLNYVDFDRPSLDDVALLPESEQFRRFGGTLAPTVRIDVDGDRTRVRGTLEHGHLPLPDEPLPEAWWLGGDADPRPDASGRAGPSGAPGPADSSRD